jgi:hypothetical protein
MHPRHRFRWGSEVMLTLRAIIGQAAPSPPARPVSDEKFGGLIARNQVRT